MPINAEWHAANRMPRNPSAEQRIAWHIAHAQHCACRPIPPKLQAEIDRYLAGSEMQEPSHRGD
jgi:Ser/Thr protein kinase RdoA (MazF antagonist)